MKPLARLKKPSTSLFENSGRSRFSFLVLAYVDFRIAPARHPTPLTESQPSSCTSGS